jgi:hypothetical protein
MTCTSDILAAVGRANLRKKLGVSDTAISNALSNGIFPAKWYLIVSSECTAINLDCPLALFSFSEAAPAEEDAA